MDKVQKNICELNYLGCYILEEDPFKEFEKAWRKNISNIEPPKEQISVLDTDKVIKVIEKAVLEKAKTTYPIVLLSGGIDSTLIASILKNNKIDFSTYSYVLSKSDPTLENIRYVEKKLNIQSNIIYYDQIRVKQVWEKYWQYYISPSLDYASLIMADFLDQVSEKINTTDYTLFDGIGADDLFGCGGITSKNYARALLFKGLSNNYTRPIDFKNKFLNIYTSSVIESVYANTLYQNYLFSKIIVGSQFPDIVEYLSEILLQNEYVKNNFYFGQTLMNLFYDGRRVAYKNLGLTGDYNIFYPFLQSDVLSFGLSIDNKLKIKPYIKEPLKASLISLDFDKSFVYAPKRGFIFNIFDILSFDKIVDSMDFIKETFELKSNYKDFLFNEYKQRNAATDHFLFGLAMTQKYISNKKCSSNGTSDEYISSF